jgi:hypothetical protein
VYDIDTDIVSERTAAGDVPKDSSELTNAQGRHDIRLQNAR